MNSPAIAAIDLLSPAPGATTPPLQAYAWTGPRTVGRDPTRLLNSAAVGSSTFDRSLPRPVRFAWRAVDADCTYRLVVARQADLRAPDAVIETRAAGADVPHLHVGATYYWQVTTAAARSPVQTFRTHPLPPRWIFVPGATNVRDCGGWTLPGGRRVRQGLVYRGSELNGHVNVTPAGRRVLEEELGVRTDLDLRGEGEEVRPTLNERRVRWINEAIRPYGEIVRDVHHPRYRRIFELFADPASYPIFFHCWGGADRAGTVAYLLHAVLGSPAEQLAWDYELTTMAIWEDRLRTQAGYRALLASLALFGNGDTSPRAQAEHYLHSIGVTDAVLEAIRANLIEPAA